MPRNPDKIDYSGGLPVPQTMTKLFSVLDTKTFSKCVASHVGALHKEVIDQFHFAKTQINRGKSEKWSLHEETEKSLPMKQMRAMANPTYREQILSLAR